MHPSALPIFIKEASGRHLSSEIGCLRKEFVEASKGASMLTRLTERGFHYGTSYLPVEPTPRPALAFAPATKATRDGEGNAKSSFIVRLQHPCGLFSRLGAKRECEPDMEQL